MTDSTTPQPYATDAPKVFTFEPTGGTLKADAYSPFFKGLALVLLAMAALWAWEMHQWGQRQAVQQATSWLWAPWGLMAYTVWFVVTGKTTLSNSAIEQSWMWGKRLELSNLAYAKVIRIKALDWLIAPRLYTKNFSGKILVFYAADATMLAELKRLEFALEATRNAR
ncbi:MAG: hypothetical protein K2X65_05090 [Burkholderiaceae bacterium]|nr:hypothetical protein [Burkholderiaceae bacterium]